MTREEALNVIWLRCQHNDKTYEAYCVLKHEQQPCDDATLKDIFCMGCEYKEQQPCDKCVYSTNEGCQYDDITETIPPFETSDDAISKQAVFEQIGGWIASGEYEFTNATDYLSKRIKAIPPLSSSENPNKCEDAVSRQAVEKITWEEPSYTDPFNVLTEVREKVRALPPVTSQQKIGHWIFVDKAKEHARCSQCGHGDVDLVDGRVHDYCEKCGAKMVVPHKESEEV